MTHQYGDVDGKEDGEVTDTRRSNKREVRNPVLNLPAVQQLMTLPEQSRKQLRNVLVDLRRDALARAEKCWRGHKAPMATYWKAVGVYAGHLARVLANSAVCDANEMVQEDE